MNNNHILFSGRSHPEFSKLVSKLSKFLSSKEMKWLKEVTMPLWKTHYP